MTDINLHEIVKEQKAFFESGKTFDPKLRKKKLFALYKAI